LISFADAPGPGLPLGVLTDYHATAELPCLVNGTTRDCDYDWSVDTYLPVEASEVPLNITATSPFNSCRASPHNLDLLEGEDLYTLADGCPILLYAPGTTSTKRFNATSFSQGKPELYGFLCHGHIEEVPTKVTLKLPQLAIRAESPPVALEGTAWKLNFTYGNYTGPSYQNSLQRLFDALPGNKTITDLFMKAVVEGKGGTNIHTLLGREGVPHLMEPVERLYATYMVQAIDSNFRVPLNASAPGLLDDL
jgi:hypothetical protein